MEPLPYLRLSLMAPFLAFSPAFSGTYVKAIAQSYTDKNQWSYVYTSLDQGKIRMDFAGPKAEDGGYLIYDRVFSQLDAVSPVKKTVVELNQTDVGEIRDYITQLFNQVTAEVKKPKKGRKKTKKIDPALQKAYLKILDEIARPVHTGVPFNGYTCDEFQISETDKNGVKKKLVDLWAVPPSATTMTVEDYQAARGIFDLLLSLIRDPLLPMGVDVDTVKRYPWYREYPVLTLFYDKGKPSFVYRVLDIRCQAFPPETFSIPADYEKTDLLTIMKALASQLKVTKDESSAGTTVHIDAGQTK